MKFKTSTTEMRDYGLITFKSTTEEPSTFEFPIDSLEFWYPLDNRYTLSYSASRDHLYVTTATKSISENVKYGIDTMAGRAKSTECRTTTTELYMAPVAKRNAEIKAYCQANGIVFLGKPCTMKELEKSYKRIGDILDLLNGRLEQIYLDTYVGGDLEALIEFNSLNDFNRSNALDKVTTAKHREYFSIIGEVYAMLSLVRKFYVRG